MAELNEEILPEEEKEVDGGAVKSFLEHLEDLRWMLIKSAAATIVAMMVCLFGTHHLVSILKWPLDRASTARVVFGTTSTNPVVTLMLGNAKLGSYSMETNQIGALNLGSNQNVVVRLEPVQNGDKSLLSMRVDHEASTSPPSHELIFLDPGAPFMSSLHLAFFGGILLASPFILYFVGQFVMPALKIREKKYFLRAFFVGLFLFFLGVSIAYFWIMPIALRFAEVYANWMGVKVLEWRAETYFSFVVKFMLGMGAGFELPVVLLGLVKVGVLSYEKLSKMRRYMIVINLILGALLTTPEWVTQVIMAIALQILFEISVWIAWYWERQEKRREALADLQGG